jgi:hypothetical protein
MLTECGIEIDIYLLTAVEAVARFQKCFIHDIGSV